MLVRDRVEVLAYVDIQHPVLPLPRDGAVQRAQRPMSRASRPEAMRAGQKVLLIDGLQNHDDRPLRHLVLEGRDAERPSRAIRLRDVRPAHRWCLVATGFDAIHQVQEIGRQVRIVGRRRYTVDAGRTILARQLVGFPHPFQVDDVMQRGQHFSRLASRQFGYPSAFRGQVCKAHVPSRVSRRWFSPRDASLPSFGSRRARFPALSGTMKALRLPTCVSMVAYWFASTAHGYLLVRVRRSAPGRSEVLFQARPVVQPAAPAPAYSYVDANGISQVFRRSFPCLCSVPRPRSNRRTLATDGHVDAAPAEWTAKASAMADFGANPQLRHSLPYASSVSLPHTCKACFRLAGSAFAGRDSNPPDRYERFQFVLTTVLLPCSPDATTPGSVYGPSPETPLVSRDDSESKPWRVYSQGIYCVAVWGWGACETNTSCRAVRYWVPPTLRGAD